MAVEGGEADAEMGRIGLAKFGDVIGNRANSGGSGQCRQSGKGQVKPKRVRPYDRESIFVAERLAIRDLFA